MDIMHITEKGQVTIPLWIRKQSGLLPRTPVEFEMRGRDVVLKKASRRKRGKKLSRGEALIKHLRGSATIKMSTDEIMRLTRGDDWNQP